jgi:hypothetical protein
MSSPILCSASAQVTQQASEPVDTCRVRACVPMYVVSVTVTGRSEIFDTDDAYGAAGSELTSSYVMRCFSSEISST